MSYFKAAATEARAQSLIHGALFSRSPGLGFRAPGAPPEAFGPSRRAELSSAMK